MRVIAWNCNMAFRNKAEYILELKPDILVVPECELIEKQIFKPGVSTPTDSLWFGSNPHKGLGIFSYSDYKFKLLDALTHIKLC